MSSSAAQPYCEPYVQAAHSKAPSKHGVVSSIFPEAQVAAVSAPTRHLSQQDPFCVFRCQIADTTHTRSCGDGGSIRMRVSQINMILSSNGRKRPMIVVFGRSKRSHGMYLVHPAAGLSSSPSRSNKILALTRCDPTSCKFVAALKTCLVNMTLPSDLLLAEIGVTSLPQSKGRKATCSPEAACKQTNEALSPPLHQRMTGTIPTQSTTSKNLVLKTPIILQ